MPEKRRRRCRHAPNCWQRQDGRLPLGEEFDAELNEQDRLDVEKIIAGHLSNPRAAEILDMTFGKKDWRKIVETTPAAERRQAFVELYREVLEDAGAKHVLSFAVTTTEGRHKYTLMHASTHPSAFRAMKEAMHRAYTQRTSPGEEQDLFGTSGIDVRTVAADRAFSSGADIREVARQVRTALSGKLVYWTGRSGDEMTLLEYALRHTPLLKHELPELEEELARLGYREGKKPRTYRFP